MGGSKFYGVNIYVQQPLLAGGLGVLTQEKFRNMKCSRSDSRPTEGYRPSCSYRAVITWVYIEFVNWGVRNFMV